MRFLSETEQILLALAIVGVVAIVVGLASYFTRNMFSPGRSFDVPPNPSSNKILGDAKDVTPQQPVGPATTGCDPATDGLLVLGSAALGGFWATVRGSWSNASQTMSLSYGTIPSSAGSQVATATVDLDTMTTPTARLAAASPLFDAFPHVKPQLLKLFQDRSGGTDAAPTYTVRLVVVGKHLTNATLVAYCANLGAYGGSLSYSATVEQEEFTFPSNTNLSRIISVAGARSPRTGSVAFLRDNDTTLDVYSLIAGSPTLASNSPSFTAVLDTSNTFPNENVQSFIDSGTPENMSYVTSAVLNVDVIPMVTNGNVGIVAGVLLQDPDEADRYRVGVYATVSGSFEQYWASD